MQTKKILKIARELTPEFVISWCPDAANGVPAELYDRDKAEKILLMTEDEHFRKLDFRERIIRIYELMDEPLGVDVLCYTPEEFKEKRKEIGIVRKALEEGVVLYGEKSEGEDN